MPCCSCRPSAGIPRAWQAAWWGEDTPAGPSGDPPGSPVKSNYSINKPRRGKFRLQDPFGCDGGDRCRVLHRLVLLSPQNLEFKVLNGMNLRSLFFKKKNKQSQFSICSEQKSPGKTAYPTAEMIQGFHRALKPPNTILGHWKKQVLDHSSAKPLSGIKQTLALPSLHPDLSTCSNTLHYMLC